MTESIIQNTKNLPKGTANILSIGQGGSGKTVQSLTLEKPCLVLSLDPNTKGTLRGYDVDIVEFPIDGVSLEISEGPGVKVPQRTNEDPTAYENLKNFFNSMQRDKGFSKYKSVVLDSITFLELAIMAAVLWKGGIGQASTDEYTEVRNRTVALTAAFTSLPLNVYMIAHQRDKEDRGGKCIGYMINATGLARQILPGMFDVVLWHRIRQSAKGPNGVLYTALTRPQGMVDSARISDHDIPSEIDMTIRDWSKPENYGLGKLIQRINENTVGDMEAAEEEEKE